MVAAVSVFCSSMVMVMGPTPPGTGVMAEAIGSTSAKLAVKLNLATTIFVVAQITDKVYLKREIGFVFC